MGKFSRLLVLQYALPLLSGLLVISASFVVGSSEHSSFYPKAQEPAQEPIAYIGHGVMFDQTGKELAPTLEFIRQAQAWYIAALSAKLTTAQRDTFSKFERELTSGLVLDKQSQLVANTYVLDRLLDMSTSENRDRIRGKNNLLKLLLKKKLSDDPNTNRREPFNPNPDLLKRVTSLLQKQHHPSGTTTTTSGAAYRALCQANGVPVPPDFGPSSTWVSRGLIPQTELFIVGTYGAEVLTWESTSPVGMCIALPRFDTGTDEVLLDGVICVGQATSKVCFWDNEKNGSVFTFTRGTSQAFTDWGGGSELVASAGGVCTSCHAGENPFVIHPNTTALGGLAGLGLPTFPDSWHDPIITSMDASAWPENPGPMNAPASCVGCHFQGYAGRFPHLSTALNTSPGYCQTILKKAIERTMPPSAPGSLDGTAEMTALLNWCGMPDKGDASSRGDPHVKTFDGTNYDFQSAGEFVYLRDANGLEIQTRQAPVATVSTPLMNAYTGLASCVSVHTAVAARVGKHRVTFQPGYTRVQERTRLELRIDGKLATLDDKGIDLGDGGRVIKSTLSEGIEIYFPDQTHLVVTPNWWESQQTWYMNVDVTNTPGREGIMGAIVPSSWLPLLANGMSLGPKPAAVHQRFIDLNQKFADSWRVTPVTSLFDYASGTSTLTYTKFNWPPETGPCTIAGSKVPPARGMDPRQAEEYCGQIVDKNMRANCIFDLTLTGEPGFAKVYQISQQIK